jgi:hypothetical protein
MGKRSYRERGVERGQLGDRGGFERGPRFLYRNHCMGAWCNSSDEIGGRGRCFWAALCTESRGMDGSVGGSLIRSERARVQCGCG